MSRMTIDPDMAMTRDGKDAMHGLMPNRYLGCLLALVAGGLTTLTASPFELWWLGPVAICLVYLGIHTLTPGQAALRGGCYGIGLFGSGASWVYVSIHDYGYTGVLLALFLTALFVIGLALIYALIFWLYRRLCGPRLAFLTFAGAWVLGEWLRTCCSPAFPGCSWERHMWIRHSLTGHPWVGSTSCP